VSEKNKLGSAEKRVVRWRRSQESLKYSLKTTPSRSWLKRSRARQQAVSRHVTELLKRHTKSEARTHSLRRAGIASSVPRGGSTLLTCDSRPWPRVPGFGERGVPAAFAGQPHSPNPQSPSQRLFNPAPPAALLAPDFCLLPSASGLNSTRRSRAWFPFGLPCGGRRIRCPDGV
jgi:hypothetical protein